MPKTDFRSPRLHVDTAFTSGQIITLTREQANYLGNVLRLRAGDTVLTFNGRDGEWRATIAPGKRAEQLVVGDRVQPQDALPDVTLAFAPLKHARLDYMVQKAVEMGAGRLAPVVTRFTQAARVNTDRMRANVVEAAEQCGILSLAAVEEPQPLAAFLAARDPARLLAFCDEAADVSDPLAALAATRGVASGVDVVIGPEGGFADEERVALLAQPLVARLALGPRILRADTAAVAALALVQAVLGDWRGS